MAPRNTTAESLTRMALTPGSRFGNYAILAAIGRGGMGEVFRAHDSTLGRDVALKVLPGHVGADPERRRRLEREAKMLAALNHPNIAAIHGYEEIDGVQGLVLELVEGATLADRIVAGPIPRAEAVNIGLQIADALETAHSAGIIHRDLKPANVKVRPDGRVKVLDFGLAKAHLLDALPRLNESPTITFPETAAGVILGTAAYMSPEQARGLPADKRADVWAFGCVLFEMLTGRRAFDGERATDALAAVISGEPKWSLLPADTPAALHRVLRRCLVKDPNARLRDLGDAQIDLRDALTEPAHDRAAGPLATPGRRRPIAALVAVAVTAAVAGGAGVWSVMRRVEPPPRSIERLTITVPLLSPDGQAGSQTAITAVRSIAISPNGKTVVYVAPAADRGAPRLYARSLDAYEPRPIEGTDGASAPFFSPDSQTVAFFAAGKLKRTSVAGGGVATICDAPDDASGGSGGAWGPNDTIVFAAPTSARAGLFRVSAYGGAPEVLATPDPADEGGLGDPAFIPGTDAVMFTSRLTKAGVSSSLIVRSLKTGEQHKLPLASAPGAAAQLAGTPVRPSLGRPQFTTGHVVFKSGSTIMAAAFDRDALEVTGPLLPIVEEVAEFSMAASGRLVYVTAPSYGGQLVWVDRHGSSEPIGEPDQRFARPRLSPNGSQLVVEVLRGSRSDIGVYRFSSRALTLITTDGASNSPVWHPDGRRVVFRVPNGLALQSTDDAGTAELLLATSDPALRSASSLAPGGFSPVDPSLFTFVVHRSAATGADIYQLTGAGDLRIKPLVERAGNQWAVRVSPDGKWISYASDESGRFEIYLESAVRRGAKHQVSNGGGFEAVWAPKGNELFYRVADRMMTVPITNDPESPVGAPQVLFSGRYQRTDLPQYDVTADGQRFVMIKLTVDDLDARTIRVVDGWFDELSRRATR